MLKRKYKKHIKTLKLYLQIVGMMTDACLALQPVLFRVTRTQFKLVWDGYIWVLKMLLMMGWGRVWVHPLCYLNPII